MSAKTIDISIVVPCYNESASLKETTSDIVRELASIRNKTFEIILVNDGSTDNTEATVKDIIREYHSHNTNIVYLSLTRNFGKEASVLAGYEHARGDILGCIDADGQHPPEDLAKMITILLKQSEVDMVVGVRKNQSHKKIGFMSTIFYKLTGWFGNTHLIKFGTDFRVMRKHVIETFLELNEKNRINRDLIDWLGYSYTTYEFAPKKRLSGSASYDTRKLISLAIDGLVSSGTKPLSLLFPLGSLIVASSVAFAIFLLVNDLMKDVLNLNITLQGYALLLIIFFFGVNLSSLGIIALYISRTFTEVRRRPHYVINRSKSTKFQNEN